MVEGTMTEAERSSGIINKPAQTASDSRVEIYKKFKNTSEHLRTNPGDFSKIRELCDELGLGIPNITDARDRGLAYLVYLGLVDLLYNTIEEDSIQRSSRVELSEVIRDKFAKISNLGESKRYDEIFSHLLDMVERFGSVLRQGNYVTKVRGKLPYKKKYIPYKLSSGKENFCVAGHDYPIFFNIDELFLLPRTVEMVGNAFAKRVKHAKEMQHINKICFIEKTYGPVGAVALLPYLVEKTGTEAVIYRPRHWNPSARLVGKLAKTDRICMVYDLALTGGALAQAAEFLEKSFEGVRVTYAIVLYDYNVGARETLAERGVKLSAIVDILPEHFRKSLLGNYGNGWRRLGEKVLNKEITYEEYIHEGKELFEKFARLELFAR